jgi:hypothetical protein
MLSATILNHRAFCESLGIPLEQTSFISLPSPFPVENRPVLVSSIGKMSAGEIDNTLPKLVFAIRQILDAHPNEKGLIHCIDEEEFVTMADDSNKQLKDVKVGDYVVTWSEEQNKFENKKVIANLDKGFVECIKINLENGKSITCTSDHKILTKNRAWVSAGELTNNDEIVSKS